MNIKITFAKIGRITANLVYAGFRGRWLFLVQVFRGCWVLSLPKYSIFQYLCNEGVYPLYPPTGTATDAGLAKYITSHLKKAIILKRNIIRTVRSIILKGKRNTKWPNKWKKYKTLCWLYLTSKIAIFVYITSNILKFWHGGPILSSKLDST